ncbi:MAG: zinc-binding dehydrogenase [Alphaproteobacteria bacterium]
MKALILDQPNAPFEMRDVPDPVAGPGEAVARVLACGSGLTIQHVKAGRIPVEFPRIIGHEITAEIVEVGTGVTDVAVGDAVTVYGMLVCGTCNWCRNDLEPLCESSADVGIIGMTCDGGYAEYIKLPAHIFVKLPEGLNHRAHPAEIGVITDALTTPYKVLGRAGVKAGETVAVFGAGGGVGIHQVMMAKRAQTRVIAVDLGTEKLDACRKASADAVVDAADGNVAEALLDMTDGRGVDVAIDYVSSDTTLETAAAALGRRGRLVILGGGAKTFQLSASDMLYKEKVILGSRYASRRDLKETLDIVARGEVWPLVTDIRPWTEAEALHARVEGGEVTGRAALLIG